MESITRRDFANLKNLFDSWADAYDTIELFQIPGISIRSTYTRSPSVPGRIQDGTKVLAMVRYHIASLLHLAAIFWPSC